MNLSSWHTKNVSINKHIAINMVKVYGLYFYGSANLYPVFYNYYSYLAKYCWNLRHFFPGLTNIMVSVYRGWQKGVGG